MPTPQPLVLVTGSSGSLGAPLVERLLSDYRVVGLDQKPLGGEPRGAGADFVRCDLTDADSVELAVQIVFRRHGPRIASCVHLAAYYDSSGEPSPLYRTLTGEGTGRLLRGLRRFEVEQFVFSSTQIVRKPAEEGDVISEQSPVEPAWDYPRSKLEAEQVIRMERGNIPAVILAWLALRRGHPRRSRRRTDASHLRKGFQSYFFPGERLAKQCNTRLLIVPKQDAHARARGPRRTGRLREPQASSDPLRRHVSKLIEN